MADARNTTFSIDFEDGGAVDAIDEMEAALAGAGNELDAVEDSFKDMGADAVDAATKSAKALDGIGDAAEKVSKKTKGVSDETEKMCKKADSLGEVFKKSWGLALKDGQKFWTALGTGFKGAFAKIATDENTFKKKFTDGLKTIGETVKHPVEALKGKLSKALLGTKKDMDGVGEGAEKAGKSTKEMAEKANKVDGGKVKGFFKAFFGVEAIKAAAKAVGNFAKGAIDSFKSTEQGAAKFNAVFKDDKKTEEWASNFSKNVGRAESEVKSFMTSSKSMFDGMGVGKEDAVEMAKVTTDISYALGNAFNMDDAEALSAMQSAIQGNADALTDYGIKLDEDTLKEQAKRDGMTKSFEKMSEAEKAQVRLNAVMAQTGDIQESALDSSGSLTNVMKKMEGMKTDFMEKIGAKFAPALQKLFGMVEKMWPKIEPSLDQLVTILTDGLDKAIPIIMNIAEKLLPIFMKAFEQLLPPIMKLAEAIVPLIDKLLPPLAELIGELVESLMPPIIDIIDILVPIIITLIDALVPIIKSLLPPLKTILEATIPLLEAVSPIIKIIGDLLVPIVEFLGKMITFFANGVAKVADFFGKMFGGSKKAKDGIEETTESVEKLNDTKLDAKEFPVEPKVEDTPAPDTSKYEDSIESAADKTEKTLSDSAVDGKNAQEKELAALGEKTAETYDNMGKKAEDAWNKSAKAARDGSREIFSILDAIANRGNVKIDMKVNSFDAPHNAKGDENFVGGWTHINEEGGEMAFLPGGTTIIPADKSAQIAQAVAQSTTNTKHSTFSISIDVQSGNISDEQRKAIEQSVYDAVRKAQQEDDRDAEEIDMLRNGYVA